MTSKQRWLWSALLLTALALRLAGLNLVPLSPAEALNALASLDVVRGADWPAGFESPLLLVGNVLLFAIFGTGDVVARLLPALGGVVLVGVPFLWRRELGEWGSLAAGMLIALSPLALFASRQVESTTLGLAGAALLVTALFRMVKSGPDRTTSVAAGVGLAVGLADRRAHV